MAKDVDVSRALKKFRRVEKKVDAGVPRALTQIAKYGQRRAVRYAPEQTGALIDYIVVRRGDGDSVQIRSNNPPESAGNRHSHDWRGETFSVPYWAATSPNAESHFTSGRHNYMELAKRDVQREASDVIEAELNIQD